MLDCLLLVVCYGGAEVNKCCVSYSASTRVKLQFLYASLCECKNYFKCKCGVSDQEKAEAMAEGGNQHLILSCWIFFRVSGLVLKFHLDLSDGILKDMLMC